MNLNWHAGTWVKRQPFAVLEQRGLRYPSLLLLELLQLRINCRLFLLEFKLVELHFRGRLRCLWLRGKTCLRLLPQRMRLAALHGPNWRARAFDYEIAQWLQFERQVHSLLRWPGDK